MTSTNRGDIKLMIDQLTHLESIDDSVTDAAITMLEAMGNELAQCQKELASKQAKIDSLMLEYCPDEMTEAQFSKWGECQMPHGKADAIKLEAFTAKVRNEAIEQAAVASWVHYMDTCKRLKMHPSEHGEWLCTYEIRNLKELP